MGTQKPRSGSRVLSILGRFSVAVLLTLVGLIVGAFIGGYVGMKAMNASPPAPATMGFETAGVASMVIFLVDLAFGAAGGAIVGLSIGLVCAVVIRRKRT
jgi:hypothetical protein